MEDSNISFGFVTVESKKTLESQENTERKELQELKDSL
jgi:hypothetical protein